MKKLYLAISLLVVSLLLGIGAVSVRARVDPGDPGGGTGHWTGAHSYWYNPVFSAPVGGILSDTYTSNNIYLTHWTWGIPLYSLTNWFHQLYTDFDFINRVYLQVKVEISSSSRGRFTIYARYTNGDVCIAGFHSYGSDESRTVNLDYSRTLDKILIHFYALYYGPLMSVQIDQVACYYIS